MQKIHWGIIGCGDVTEIKSGPGFHKATNSELIAVMRRNSEHAADYARRHNVAKWYSQAQDLINDPQIDAVYIATPPSSHKEYTLMAAAASKPVYVEKPMALNTIEAQDMIKACRDANVSLYVAYYRRALPRFLYIKELIDNGSIGEIHFVNTTLCKLPPKKDTKKNIPWRLDPSISGGGLFVDLAAHTLDFLDYVLGPIQSVAGYAGNQSKQFAAEDIVTATFKFTSGVQAIGLWSFNSFEEQDLTEIVGEYGKISFSVFDTSPIRVTTQQGTTEVNPVNPEHVQQPLIQLVVNDLLGLDTCPSTGETALRTTRIMDEILSGYYHSNHQSKSMSNWK